MLNRSPRLLLAVAVGALMLPGLNGCGLEEVIFPVQPIQLLDEPPAELGPYGFTETRIELDDLGDGAPGGWTVFLPQVASGARPATIWVLGLNNRAHYHQSFHEYMASWGYVQIIPDTRAFRFTDNQYHRRIQQLALKAFDEAVNNRVAGAEIDPQRVLFGGYSSGGSVAAFAAAAEPRAAALVMWAPAPAPIWQGVDPDALLPQISYPSLFLLAELDDVTPADAWPAEMQRKMTASTQTVRVVPQGVHLFFQQPAGVDDRNPNTMITRPEQMRQALEITRSYLDETLQLER